MPRPRRSRPPDSQLALFQSESTVVDSGSLAVEKDDELDRRFERLAALASRLPPEVRFGTSSWSFPGWEGLVFPKGHSESSLARRGLELYVRHPLLRTVGIDRSYYAPIGEDALRSYAGQLPAGFPCCAKVPGLFTTPVHLGHSRAPRGETNPSFLDVDRFNVEVTKPFLCTFRDHCGPMILEFPPLPRAHRIAPDPFCEKLDTFLGALPRDLPYAVEIRDRALLTKSYADVLAAHGVSHVYNYWSGMPLPFDQVPSVPLDRAPFVVVRLLMRPGTRYDDRAATFRPFDRIVEPDSSLRDQVLDIIRLTLRDRRAVFVLVNNKAEGSAPLTIEALAEMLGETEPAR